MSTRQDPPCRHQSGRLAVDRAARQLAFDVDDSTHLYLGSALSVLPGPLAPR